MDNLFCLLCDYYRCSPFIMVRKPRSFAMWHISRMVQLSMWSWRYGKRNS